MIKMETNKKVYYKGHPTRGAEIIKALEELGGINNKNIKGNGYNSIYFLAKDINNTIYVANANTDFYRFVISNYKLKKLPEPKIKFKDGDFLTSILSGTTLIFKEVISELSFYSHYNSVYGNNDTFWNLNSFRLSTPEEKQHLLNIIDKNGKVWNEEKKCIEDKVHVFKPKDWVLVRNDNTDRWLLSIFSFEQHTDEYPFVTIANEGYKQCIPYEGNENLLGTTNDK